MNRNERDRWRVEKAYGVGEYEEIMGFIGNFRWNRGHKRWLFDNGKYWLEMYGVWEYASRLTVPYITVNLINAPDGYVLKLGWVRYIKFLWGNWFKRK